MLKFTARFVTVRDCNGERFDVSKLILSIGNDEFSVRYQQATQGALIERWIKSEEDFKFVGNNVAKTKVVRDIRSDHRSHLVQMYSILAVKSRVHQHPLSPLDFSPLNVKSLRVDSV